MATYNSSEFLQAQLDSLFEQTDQDWELLIRDDSSTDQTPTILASYQERYPSRIHLYRSETNVGARENFSTLLEIADADYIALADADDVWLARKIEAARAEVVRQEAPHGRNTPVLVHSDLRVVDHDLRSLASSFWAYQGLDVPGGHPLRRILMQNVVTGCSTMFNRSLLGRCRPVPPEAIMHDWWLALVASAAGVISELREPSVLYRQHAANRVGAKRGNPIGAVAETIRNRTLWNGEALKALRENIVRTQHQARALDRSSGTALTPAQRAMVSAYGSVGTKPWLARRFTLLRHGLLKAGLIRNAVLLGFA